MLVDLKANLAISGTWTHNVWLQIKR